MRILGHFFVYLRPHDNMFTGLGGLGGLGGYPCFFCWRSPVRTERVSTSERTQYATKTLFSLITAPIRFKTIEISEATQTQPTSRLAGAVRIGASIDNNDKCSYSAFEK